MVWEQLGYGGSWFGVGIIQSKCVALDPPLTAGAACTSAPPSWWRRCWVRPLTSEVPMYWRSARSAIYETCYKGKLQQYAEVIQNISPQKLSKSHKLICEISTGFDNNIAVTKKKIIKWSKIKQITKFLVSLFKPN